MTDVIARTGSAAPQLGTGAAQDTPAQILTALGLIALSVPSFLIGTPFGLGVCFLLALALCVVRPGWAPVMIITAFMFQNTIIAAFTPMVASDATFDALRGINFVILMTAFGAFLAGSLQPRLKALPQLRPWFLGGAVLLLVIGFYLALGAVRGELRDAVVYFRNTITPVACFHIGLVAASLYRVQTGRAIAWLGVAAALYGYGELFLRLDFLTLFNGDEYIQRQMAQQIATGYWEKLMQETGFVLRGTEDVMTTSFFNTPVLGGIFPDIWRLAGPNFHPISYAYALAIIAVFLLFKGRWMFAVVALPLLLVVGSKGAMALVLVALGARLGVKLLGRQLTTVLVVAAGTAWVAVAIIIGMHSGDFHVLGLFAGIRDFAANPLGQGLGIGGNLSAAAAQVEWSAAQESGATVVPVESAVGVMLYQMGIGSFLFFGLLAGVAARCRRIFLNTGDQTFLFAFVCIVMLSANGVLQEEAFYSPLALGFCLLLTGAELGAHWRRAGGTLKAEVTE